MNGLAHDSSFACPLIPTDSAQLLAAVATGSTVLGSLAVLSLPFNPFTAACLTAPIPSEPLRFTFHYLGFLFSASLAAHLGCAPEPPWNVALSSAWWSLRLADSLLMIHFSYCTHL